MKTIRVVVLLLLALAAASAARAQVTETSVAFDSAGKVRDLTPTLATRFELRPPAWPVTGDFVEARLYSVSTGGHVLAVERPDRRVERYQLSADNVAALRFAIDAAMARSGQAVTEDRRDAISQPARGAFVRNQMLLTWLVYGPSLAAMSQDAQSGTALYLLATGASYFITTGVSRRMVVTRAQNHLASDGAIRGWGAAAGLTYALGGDDVDGRTVAATGLVGSLGGAIFGFQRATRLTDSEAQAAATVSNVAAATALGVVGASGVIDDGDDDRGPVAAIVAAGLLGYALGPEYPRRAKYTVTRGDIQVAEVGGILGAALGLLPFVRDGVDPDPAAVFSTATAGMLAGGFLAERQWSRRYDHSSWDANQTRLGALAGILMGSAAAVLTEPNVQTGYALVVGGATFGAILGHNLAAPARAGTTSVGSFESIREPRVSVRASASAAALGALGVPGRHSLIRVSF